MDFRKIEEKWQKKWDKAKVFEADVNPKKKKFFTSLIIPYVNGRLHIGHAFTFGRSDAYARFKRMQGYNMLLAQGFHATGEPILGAIKRLKDGDKDQIETFKAYGTTDKDLENFKKHGAEFVARFWTEKIIEDAKSMGYSIDWRRMFITAIQPTFNRFIEWQYNTLRKKGLVIQGTHPVIWCPHCQSPTGDHDRLRGEGESPIEYVIIKFRLDSGEVIPTGTLRPETMYGATNIWINPDANYVWANIGNEKWLLGEKAVEKLKDQLKKVNVVGKVKGEDLVGRYVNNPFNKTKMIILPAGMVDPNGATGVVVSVPSHAPYDWAALMDLQKNPDQLKKYKIDSATVKQIKPISMIKAEGFGEHPAIELYNKMGIKNQGDKEKLDEATSILYKKEYHTGILKDNCNDYAGLKVSECKERLIKDFIKQNYAGLMWEMTGDVVCRCKTPNHVKILENQWFLKFSDKDWKDKVKRCISQMKFYPDDVRIQFLNTVDWLKDKACARKTGLGTKLPWDKDWIVETLSDSTIYMAYYTIAKVVNDNKIAVEKLTDEVFDYVLLGKGNSKDLGKKVKLNPKLLEEMRKEFEYFYPVDIRNSGKDLVQNHLTFYLFHHTGIWDNSKYWPRAIGANGFVQVSGEKMSKRLGNIIPLKDLIRKYGADIVRINLISSNENMDDADWREENVQAFASRLNFLNGLIVSLKKCRRKGKTNVDLFLLSRIQKHIEETTNSYEETKFRSGIQSSFFNFVNDLKWYSERCGKIENCNKDVLSYALSTIVKLVAPLAPHVCEEYWQDLGNKGFISTSEWPKADSKLIDREGERNEELVKQILEDISEIQKITGKKAKKAYVIVAPSWKFKVYKTIMENRAKEMKEIIPMVLKKLNVKDSGEVVKYVQMSYRKIKEAPRELVSRENQMAIFKETKEFMENQLKCKVILEDAEKSKLEKARQADAIKPAIYLE